MPKIARRATVSQQPGALTLSEDDRRVLAVWAADCAERTLPLFEAQAPNDARPRDAIDGIRIFASGEKRIGELDPFSEAARHQRAERMENGKSRVHEGLGLGCEESLGPC